MHFSLELRHLTSNHDDTRGLLDNPLFVYTCFDVVNTACAILNVKSNLSKVTTFLKKLKWFYLRSDI